MKKTDEEVCYMNGKDITDALSPQRVLFIDWYSWWGWI